MRSAIRKVPLYEQAYDAVRVLLRERKLDAGEVFTELRLTEMLGMSRTPVREAVRRLIAENLIEALPGMGLRIPLPTPGDFAEVYYTRAALEGEAARIAATVATDEFCRDLEDLYDRMNDAIRDADTPAVAAANGAFHRRIVDFAGNKRIANVLSGFESIIVRYRSFSLSVPAHQQQSAQDHRHLIDLMRRGDADGAAEFARNHTFRAGGRVVLLLRRLEGIQTPASPTERLLLSRADDLEA